MSKPKKYKVIYADPPWYQKAGRAFNGYSCGDGKQDFNASGSSRDLPYKTMPIEDICALNVRELSADDSWLFVWVTNKYLPYANQVITAWGFTYSTTLVWCKNTMGGGMGGAFGVSTEYLIVARKGRPKPKKRIKTTWFNVKRQYVGGYPCHSKKPDFFRELIESVCDGDKLEMFARSAPEGWDVFGNEAPNSIEIGAKND